MTFRFDARAALADIRKARSNPAIVATAATVSRNQELTPESPLRAPAIVCDCSGPDGQTIATVAENRKEQRAISAWQQGAIATVATIAALDGPEYEERDAIAEFEGGLPRAEAEALARRPQALRGLWRDFEAQDDPFNQEAWK